MAADPKTARADRTQWEYRFLIQSQSESVNVDRLNELGMEGWELVHVGHINFIMKRARTEAAAYDCLRTTSNYIPCPVCERLPGGGFLCRHRLGCGADQGVING
jgi:hypothetical protein